MNIQKEQIFINKSFKTAEEAIIFTGEKLLAANFIKEEYIETMLKRHQQVSVYIGNFIALPHGKSDDTLILKEGLVVIQVPDGIDFGDKTARQVATIIIGVALKKDSQLGVLQELAFLGADIETVRKMSDARSEEEILEILNNSLFN